MNSYLTEWSEDTFYIMREVCAKCGRVSYSAKNHFIPSYCGECHGALQARVVKEVHGELEALVELLKYDC